MTVLSMITLVLISILVAPQNIMISGEMASDLKNDGILYNPANENIYVVHDWMRSLTAINSSNGVAGTFFVGEEPIYLAYNPINKYLYVTDHFDGVVMVLNSSNAILTALIPDEECAGDCWPEEVGYNPINQTMYATMPTDDTIVIYDNDNNKIDEILTNTDPYRLLASDHLAFDPVQNKTYITNSNWDSVSVITNTSQIKEIEVGHRQNLIQYVPFNKDVYVSLGDSIHSPNGTIAVINTINDNVFHISFDKLYGESYIGSMSYNPFNEQIYFAGLMNVYIIDRNNQMISNIPLVGGPCAIKYHPGNNNMYVGSINGTVTVINSENQVISSIAVGGYPCSMAYNPINHNIYTRDYNAETVSVINDENKLVATIPIPYLDSEKYPS